MTETDGPAPTVGGNYVSEWFGRRIYPRVLIQDVSSLTGRNSGRCPFLSEMLGPTDCWKGLGSKGVCTISAASNRDNSGARMRQDWLACPHQVIHTDLVRRSCVLIFGAEPEIGRPVPITALSDASRFAAFKSEVREAGRGFLFFQDKLGGEISLGGTATTPQMSFDVTIVEVLPGPTEFVLGRYGVMEIQTMDFHGNYKGAVGALSAALDLHRGNFPIALQDNLDWARRGVEGPNIANVFKRTFYQMLLKFQLASGASMAGTVLALPRAVWDSWQPFLGRPRIAPAGADGIATLEGAEAGDLNAFICVFDIEAEAVSRDVGATGVAGADDISPIRVERFIRVTPGALARQAFTHVPAEILRNIEGSDLILTTIRGRLRRVWPDLQISTDA